MPEISIQTGVIFACIFAIIGWTVGLNLNLLIQLGTIVVWVSFLNSWQVKELEIGAFHYAIIFAGYMVGLMAADAIYYILYGLTVPAGLKSIGSTIWEVVTP